MSWMALAWLFGGGGCGAPPASTSPAVIAAQTETTPALGRRRTDIPDDCDEVPGRPPPEPLRTQYTGVAKAARCQREVYTIMGGVTHFLGVTCKHCHLEPDYAADTHNKQVANWMARELVPRLKQREATGDNAVWCKDCHAGKAKFLGNPRQRSFAIEWMTMHLVEDLETTSGKSLKCKQCHRGDLGSPQFEAKIILSELSGLPSPPAPVVSSAAPTPVAPPASAASPEPAVPIPDFGAR